MVQSIFLISKFSAPKGFENVPEVLKTHFFYSYCSFFKGFIINQRKCEFLMNCASLNNSKFRKTVSEIKTVFSLSIKRENCNFAHTDEF